MNKLIQFFRKEGLINLAINFNNILIIVYIFSKLKLWCKPIRVFIAVGMEMDMVILSQHLANYSSRFRISEN